MNYKKIASFYEECFKKYGPTHSGLAWPNAEDMWLRHKIMLDLVKTTDGSILDFGCGTGSLLKYLRLNNWENSYIGIDINPDSVSFCQNEYGQDRLAYFECMDILKDGKIPETDYTIINGVFTVKDTLTQDQMWDFMSSTIKKLFEKSKKGIAFNLMQEHVDYKKDNLFHVPFDKLADFLKKNLSRHYRFDSSYKLYEYTTYVYKEPQS